MSSLFSAPIEGKTYMKLKEIQTLTVQLFSLRPRFKLPVWSFRDTQSPLETMRSHYLPALDNTKKQLLAF